MEEDTEVIELLRDLVRIETENPPGNERECAEYIHTWFDEQGVETKLIEAPAADRPQVVGKVGEGAPTVVLNGHIDVVPAGNEDEWTYDPYGAVVDDGKLYGRGAVDMKAGLVIAMIVTRNIGDEILRGEYDGSVIFHGAMGEETGAPGTKTLLERGYTGEYGIVLEPTSMRIATATKGTAWYTITIAGEPSHASRPDQGINAIERATPVLGALSEYGAEVRNRTDELVGTAFATITEISAGTKENVVPERAEITVDRRVLLKERFEDIDDEIDSLLEDVASENDVEIEWERYQIYEPSSTPGDSSVAEVFREQLEAQTDVATEPWGIPAATDTRNLINDAGMDAITWGPGALSQAHTIDECISQDEVFESLDVLEDATRRLLQ